MPYRLFANPRRLFFLLLTLTFAVLTFGPLSGQAQPIVKTAAENHGLGFSEVGELTLDSLPVSPEAQEDWERLYPFVVGLISDELIVSLSRYSVEATKEFHFEAAEPGALKVFGFNEKFVIYEATLARLPAAPAVVRELKVFILSPRLGQHLYANELVITVRGARFER